MSSVGGSALQRGRYRMRAFLMRTLRVRAFLALRALRAFLMRAFLMRALRALRALQAAGVSNAGVAGVSGVSDAAVSLQRRRFIVVVLRSMKF